MALNSFTIYLLKDFCKISEYEKYLKNSMDFPEVNAQNLPKGAKMRYAFSASATPPEWFSFWGIQKNDTNAAARALVFIPVKSRIFVLSYGLGYVHLNSEYIERDFGLETAKRIVDSSAIKSADTFDLSMAKKQKTQFAADYPLLAFGIDFDNTLLKNITGNLKSSVKFNGDVHTVTGSDSLRLSCKLTPSNIISFLDGILTAYNNPLGQGDIDLSGRIKLISNKVQISSLFNGLEKDLVKGNVNFSLPGLIDYSKYSGCSTQKLTVFDSSKIKNTFTGTDIGKIYLEKKKKTTASCIEDFLKKIQFYVYNDEELTNAFTLKDCISYESKKATETIFFHEGRWYEISNDFIKQVENGIKKCIEKKIKYQLPAYTKKMVGSKMVNGKNTPDSGEGNYNKQVAQQNAKDFVLMDKDLIVLPEGKFEACDLIKKTEQPPMLIHVKAGLHSATLSHLFNQGVVSTNLLINDSRALQIFQNRIPDKSLSKRLSGKNFSILYAVLTKNPQTADLPLFSKISFWKAIKNINQMGKEVRLVFIESQV